MMGKAKRKMTNWSQYSKALINRGSLIFWIDEQAINSWCCSEHHDRRGRQGIYTSELLLILQWLLKMYSTYPSEH